MFSQWFKNKAIILSAAFWFVLVSCITSCDDSGIADSLAEGTGAAGTSAAGSTGSTIGASGSTATNAPTEGDILGAAGGTSTATSGSGEQNQTGNSGGANGPATAGEDTKSAAGTPDEGVAGAAGTPDEGAVAGADEMVDEEVAGTAGTVDEGTTGTAAGDNPRLTHHQEDLGEGDGQDVITIGDSWMNIATNGGGIEGGLDRVTNKRYRHHGVAATTVLSGVIPGQYTTAKAINPDIKSVIMTGGGNDVIMDPTMIGDCMAGGDRCRQRLIDVMERLAELWTEMSADGVRDVFVVNYAEGAGTGVGDIDVTNEYKEAISKIPPPIVLHYIETTDIVNGRLADGIHPTLQACTDIAQAVYDHMVEAGARR